MAIWLHLEKRFCENASLVDLYMSNYSGDLIIPDICIKIMKGGVSMVNTNRSTKSYPSTESYLWSTDLYD